MVPDGIFGTPPVLPNPADAKPDADPTAASLILCLESVFALIAGMVILGEMMSMREIIGCVIMFAAIIVANLPAKEKGDVQKQ